MDDAAQPRSWAATWWGVLGYTAILGQALYRLVPLALEPVRHGRMTAMHWTLYAASILFNGYFEDYRAFQGKVAPRIVTRGLYLGRNPTALRVVLAPFFCSGFFHASRRRMITAWLFYPGLIVIIVAVRQLSQPWRGIVDAGVVVGLGWGAIAVLVLFARALAGHPPPTSAAELPEGAE